MKNISTHVNYIKFKLTLVEEDCYVTNTTYASGHALHSILHTCVALYMCGGLMVHMFLCLLYS